MKSDHLLSPDQMINSFKNLHFEQIVPGKCHWISNHGIILSRDKDVYWSYDQGSTWKLVAKVPVHTLDKFKSFCHLSSRLFRSGIYHIFLSNQNNLVIFGFGYIWKFSKKNNDWSLASPPVAISGSRPLHVSGTENIIVYGEYFSNPERKPVKIWASKDEGTTWQPIYQFENIRHIHGIFWDEYTSTFWITTGDNDEECGIWRTNPQFSTVEKIFGGSQLARTVQLVFSRTHVFFGTDAPAEPNYICCMEKSGKNFMKLQKVTSPVFHACQAGEYLFFSTACEPSRINQTKYASIWGRDPHSKKWMELVRYQKDIWPMKLFQYGQIFFPKGRNNTNFLWYTPFATEYDQMTFKIDISLLFG